MQPKPDTTLANSVAEIVKTFISHPNHGMNASEIPSLIRDIVGAFKDATLSDLAVAAPSQAALPAPAAAPTSQPAVESMAAPAAAAKEDVKKARSKTRKSREAASTDAGSADAVAEEAAAEPSTPAEEEGPAPVPTLEERFGDKISRKPIMDPMKAVERNQIICLIDGVPKKMLHRWLRSKWQMEPHEYREWFNLPDDYPMTAPGYSKEKSDYAKTVGLGTAEFSGRGKRKSETEVEAEAVAEVPAEAAPVETPKATPKTSRRKRRKRDGEKAKKAPSRSRAEENA